MNTNEESLKNIPADRMNRLTWMTNHSDMSITVLLDGVPIYSGMAPEFTVSMTEALESIHSSTATAAKELGKGDEFKELCDKYNQEFKNFTGSEAAAKFKSYSKVVGINASTTFKYAFNTWYNVYIKPVKFWVNRLCINHPVLIKENAQRRANRKIRARQDPKKIYTIHRFSTHAFSISLLSQIHRVYDLLNQSMKDGTTNIDPFIIKMGLPPSSLKKIFGKSLWKKLCKNSFSRNYYLSGLNPNTSHHLDPSESTWSTTFHGLSSINSNNGWLLHIDQILARDNELSSVRKVYHDGITKLIGTNPLINATILITSKYHDKNNLIESTKLLNSVDKICDCIVNNENYPSILPKLVRNSIHYGMMKDHYYGQSVVPGLLMKSFTSIGSENADFRHYVESMALMVKEAALVAPELTAVELARYEKEAHYPRNPLDTMQQFLAEFKSKMELPSTILSRFNGSSLVSYPFLTKEYLKYNTSPLKQLVKDHHEVRSLTNKVSDYGDMIIMLNTLNEKFDPRKMNDFKKYHDEVTDRYNLLTDPNSVQDIKYPEWMDEFRVMEYEVEATDNLPARAIKIRRLSRGIDYAREGKKMHHCIKSYYDRALRCQYLAYSITDGEESVTLGLNLQLTRLMIPYISIDQYRGVCNANVTNRDIINAINKLVNNLKDSMNKNHKISDFTCSQEADNESFALAV